MRVAALIAFLLLALCAPLPQSFGVGGGAAYAQTTSGQPDYEAWESVAAQAEQMLESGGASISFIRTRRETLSTWRAEFLAAQDVNAARIATLNTQIDSLGPPPAEGDSEAAQIAELREALNKQLADLQAPRLRAVEAYNRADGLIVEIDAYLRTRETERLLELGPSPLNPTNWQDAVTDLWGSLRTVYAEVAQSVTSGTRVRALTSNAPLILVLLAASLIAWRRVPHWLSLVTARVARRPVQAAPRLNSLLDDIVLFGVRVAVAFALATALKLTSYFGVRGEALINALPIAAIGIFAGPLVGHRYDAIPGGQANAAPIARIVGGLGLIWAANDLIRAWGELAFYSEATRAVLHMPLVLFGGLLLWRLGGLIQPEPSLPEPAASEEEIREPGFRERALRALRVLSRAVGIVAPIAGAIGYMSAALALLFPTIATLALIAFVMILSSLARDIYAVIRMKDDDALAVSLAPVLVNFGLVLIALPFGLLLWGMRTDQLTELWARFQEGFSLGDTRITPSDFLTFAVVFAIGYVITRALQSTLRNSVLPKTKIDAGGQTAIVSGLGYVGIVIAAFIAISSAGIDLSSLAIVAGALSVGIGFGLQNIVSNFVSGIILLIERPVAEGDWIEVGGTQGYVKEISVRSTRIETFDRSDVIVPNADLVASTVTNYTKGNLIGRVIVPVGVAYGTDTKRVEGILREIAEAHPLVTLNPPPNVLFQNFGADSLEFEIRAILRDVNYVMAVKSDLNHEIARRFTEEGIEIPFAQRDIWLRNPEVLSGLNKTEEE